MPAVIMIAVGLASLREQAATTTTTTAERAKPPRHNVVDNVAARMTAALPDDPRMSHEYYHAYQA
eukprot:6083694-Alexandrium_andersonii.AAC.1